MRVSVRQGWGAAAGALVLVLASACGGSTGGGAERTTAACVDGTFTWSGVRHREKLTQLADPITLEEAADSYSGWLRPVDDTVYRPTVTGAPAGVGAARVIRALGRHLRTEEPLAGPSETEQAEDERLEMHIGDLKGSYYAWGAINFVEADFAYTCEGRTSAKGHVVTWQTLGQGFLSCSDTHPGIVAGTAGSAAARRLCPTGSVAVAQG